MVEGLTDFRYVLSNVAGRCNGIRYNLLVLNPLVVRCT